LYERGEGGKQGEGVVKERGQVVRKRRILASGRGGQAGKKTREGNPNKRDTKQKYKEGAETRNKTLMGKKSQRDRPEMSDRKWKRPKVGHGGGPLNTGGTRRGSEAKGKKKRPRKWSWKGRVGDGMGGW